LNSFDTSHFRLALSVLDLVKANFWSLWSWLMWLKLPTIGLFTKQTELLY
jgi:hypothetical protein